MEPQIRVDTVEPGYVANGVKWVYTGGGSPVLRYYDGATWVDIGAGSTIQDDSTIVSTQPPVGVSFPNGTLDIFAIGDKYRFPVSVVAETTLDVVVLALGVDAVDIKDGISSSYSFNLLEDDGTLIHAIPTFALPTIPTPAFPSREGSPSQFTITAVELEIGYSVPAGVTSVLIEIVKEPTAVHAVALYSNDETAGDVTYSWYKTSWNVVEDQTFAHVALSSSDGVSTSELSGTSLFDYRIRMGQFAEIEMDTASSLFVLDVQDSNDTVRSKAGYANPVVKVVADSTTPLYIDTLGNYLSDVSDVGGGIHGVDIRRASAVEVTELVTSSDVVLSDEYFGFKVVDASVDISEIGAVGLTFQSTTDIAAGLINIALFEGTATVPTTKIVEFRPLLSQLQMAAPLGFPFVRQVVFPIPGDVTLDTGKTYWVVLYESNEDYDLSFTRVIAEATGGSSVSAVTEGSWTQGTVAVQHSLHSWYGGAISGTAGESVAIQGESASGIAVKGSSEHGMAANFNSKNGLGVSAESMYGEALRATSTDGIAARFQAESDRQPTVVVEGAQSAGYGAPVISVEPAYAGVPGIEVSGPDGTTQLLQNGIVFVDGFDSPMLAPSSTDPARLELTDVGGGLSSMYVQGGMYAHEFGVDEFTRLKWYTGPPTGVQMGSKGALIADTLGGEVYVKKSGNETATGWERLARASEVASGGLSTVTLGTTNLVTLESTETNPAGVLVTSNDDATVHDVYANLVDVNDATSRIEWPETEAATTQSFQIDFEGIPILYSREITSLFTQETLLRDPTGGIALTLRDLSGVKTAVLSGTNFTAALDIVIEGGDLIFGDEIGTRARLQSYGTDLTAMLGDDSAMAAYHAATYKIGVGTAGMQLRMADPTHLSLELQSGSAGSFTLDVEGAVRADSFGATGSNTTLSWGSTSPEGALTAYVGALYGDTVGGAAYVKEIGDGNDTGWEELAKLSDVSGAPPEALRTSATLTDSLSRVENIGGTDTALAVSTDKILVGGLGTNPSPLYFNSGDGTSGTQADLLLKDATGTTGEWWLTVGDGDNAADGDGHLWTEGLLINGDTPTRFTSGGAFAGLTLWEFDLGAKGNLLVNDVYATRHADPANSTSYIEWSDGLNKDLKVFINGTEYFEVYEDTSPVSNAGVRLGNPSTGASLHVGEFQAGGSIVDILSAQVRSTNTFEGSSDTDRHFNILSTYNQTSTAGSVDLEITRTETFLGSGTHQFLNFQVDADSKFAVDTDGNVSTDGDVTVVGDILVGGRIVGDRVCKTYGFTSQGIGAGTYFIGGWYNAPAAHVVLNEGSTLVTLGTASTGYGAHAFIVASGAGTATPSGTATIIVSGTSVTEAGVRTTTDSEEIVADIKAMATNSYYESTKKWVGQVTFTLTPDTPTAYAATFNYGFAKYEDCGNKAFVLDEISLVGLAGASDNAFDFEIMHHADVDGSANWTYSAAAFVPGMDENVADWATDYGAESYLTAGEYFAWKRTGLAHTIAGDADEGVMLRVTTGQNNSVQSMDITVCAVLN